MKAYYYDGPVMRFENCVQNRWKASTYAQSQPMTEEDVAYRYKKENGMTPNTKITLPGKLIPA